LQMTMTFHLSLASDLHAPCDLRLLNPGRGGSQIMNCSSEDPKRFKAEVASARKTIMGTYPQYQTPLTHHVYQVHDRLQREAPQLRARGQRVCVILATDGLPSDNPRRVRGGPKEAFRQALNSLHGLPVWVVIRLLTDDEDVVDYWNDLDQQVELPLEVLDDWEGEAREVHALNPWINYTRQLHHAREMGLLHPIFDLMDEKPFGAAEVMQFMSVVFGEDLATSLPHPSLDIAAFIARLQVLLQGTDPAFNILRKRPMPLVNTASLKKHLQRYSKGRNANAAPCCVIC